MSINKDIEQAIYELRMRAVKYAKYERYYDGDHDLAFATEKFENAFGSLFREFSLNLCPIICDAVRDKLKVKGFSIDSFKENNKLSKTARECLTSTLKTENTSSDLPPSVTSDAAAREIWSRNRMGIRSGELHKEILKCGDAYVIVWPDTKGRASIYPNSGSRIAVWYDDDDPTSVAWAAKTWTSRNKEARINLYYPDRTERFVSSPIHPPGSKLSDPDSQTWNSAAGTWKLDSVVPNPYGKVPVFHFANNADIGLTGRSELEHAIPIQDGLNKSVLDMLVAMEFSAFRQRWASGIEVDFDNEGNPVNPFVSGVQHLWATASKEAKFGDFAAAELKQFLAVKDSFRVDMASVTGTPLHYFLQNTGGFPSGESLKKAETRFLAKVRDRHEAFGQVWSDIMAFAVRIEQNDDVIFRTEWEDPSPISEREFLENLLLKRQIGLSAYQALNEAGYGAAHVAEMLGTPAPFPADERNAGTPAGQ